MASQTPVIPRKRRLLQYISEQKLDTEGEYLEYYVVDNFIAEDIKDYVTEISIKLR